MLGSHNTQPTVITNQEGSVPTLITGLGNMSLIHNDTLNTFIKTTKIQSPEIRSEKLTSFFNRFKETPELLSQVAALSNSPAIGKTAIALNGLANLNASWSGFKTALTAFKSAGDAASLVGMVNPALGILASIMAIGSIFGENKEDEFQKAVISYLQCIRGEMHAGFNQVNKNLGVLYDILCIGLRQLESLINQNTKELATSITSVASSVNTSIDREEVILLSIQDVYFAELNKTITQAKLILNDPISYNSEKKQEIIDELFHWLTEGLKKPVSNSLNEIFGNHLELFKKINFLIQDPADYAKHIGFLAVIAKNISDDKKIQNINVYELMNPNYWHNIFRNYLHCRIQFTGVHDKNQLQAKGISDAGMSYITMTDAIRQKTFLQAIFKLCSEDYKKIEKLREDCIDAANKTLQAELKKQYPNAKEVKCDIREDALVIISKFTDSLSLREPTNIKVTLDGVLRDDINLVPTTPTYYTQLEKYLTPAMKFLIRTGNASINSAIKANFGLGIKPENAKQTLSYTLKNSAQQAIATADVSLRHYSACTETCYERAHGTWNSRKYLRNSKIDKNLNAADKSSQVLAIEVINEYRKSAERLFLTVMNEVEVKENLQVQLDARITLLQSYCYIAGIQPDEMKCINSLKKSKEIIDEVNKNIESKESIKFSKWSDTLKSIENVLLAKANKPDYFNNDDYKNILIDVNCIQEAPKIKQKIEQEDKQEKLKQYIHDYSETIDRWNTINDSNWFKKIKNFTSILKRLDEINALFTEIKKTTTSQKQISLLITLDNLCRKYHTDLKISYHNEYRISDDETNFVAKRELEYCYRIFVNEDLKAAEAKLPTISQTKIDHKDSKSPGLTIFPAATPSVTPVAATPGKQIHQTIKS